MPGTPKYYLGTNGQVNMQDTSLIGQMAPDLQTSPKNFFLGEPPNFWIQCISQIVTSHDAKLHSPIGRKTDT